jgi:acyl transferase domain-containing protein
MKDEISIAACDPILLTPEDKPTPVTLRFEIVEDRQRSGKYAYVAVNLHDAMKLLGLLNSLREQHGIQIHGEPTSVTVPGKKERH